MLEDFPDKLAPLPANDTGDEDQEVCNGGSRGNDKGSIMMI